MTDLEPRHGVDGWGLEKFERETYVSDGVVKEVGYYLYERRKPYEQKEVTRVLGTRRREPL